MKHALKRQHFYILEIRCVNNSSSSQVYDASMQCALPINKYAEKRGKLYGGLNYSFSYCFIPLELMVHNDIICLFHSIIYLWKNIYLWKKVQNYVGHCATGV